MGLLPIQTVFAGEKMRTRVQGTFEGLSGSLSSLSQVPLEGYEIHMGVTTPVEGTPDSPLNLLENRLYRWFTTWTPPAWGLIFMAFSTIRNS